MCGSTLSTAATGDEQVFALSQSFHRSAEEDLQRCRDAHPGSALLLQVCSGGGQCGAHVQAPEVHLPGPPAGGCHPTWEDSCLWYGSLGILKGWSMKLFCFFLLVIYLFIYFNESSRFVLSQRRWNVLATRCLAWPRSVCRWKMFRRQLLRRSPTCVWRSTSNWVVSITSSSHRAGEKSCLQSEGKKAPLFQT